MKRTTSLPPIMPLMRSAVAFAMNFPSKVKSARHPQMQRPVQSLRYRGFEGECVEGATHLALERVVDHLMLLHPALALECLRGDARAEMITVACQIDHDKI